MKKNNLLKSIIILLSILTLLGCSNPIGPKINNYKLGNINVQISKSDIVAKYLADSALEKLGTFTDSFNEISLIKTKIDKKFIQGYKGNPGFPFVPMTDFNDLSLNYPISIHDEINKSSLQSTAFTTYYAKFHTEKNMLEIRRGAFGDEAIESYYYMVLPDSQEEIDSGSFNGFDIYLAKENGKKAIAMISNIVPSGNSVKIYYKTLITKTDTPANIYKFFQIKSETVYNDLEMYNNFYKENHSESETRKFKYDFITKYPDFGINDYKSAFYNNDFPSQFTQNIWKYKKEIATKFTAKKKAVNSIFNLLYTRVDSSHQDFTGTILINGEETPVTYTTRGSIGDELKIEGYTLLDFNYFKFPPITTFQNQFFSDFWYYDYTDGKVTAYLTDKGNKNEDIVSSNFIEGDSISFKLIKSDCDNEPLPKAITISAKMNVLKETILMEIPNINLTRTNFTAAEINKILKTYDKWNVTASDALDKIPQGTIEFLTIPCKGNIWNLEDSDENLYITYTSNKENDYYYVNKKECPIHFYNNTIKNKPCITGNIDLGNRNNKTTLELLPESDKNSMFNMNNYVISDVTYKNGNLILIGDPSNSNKPITITLSPISN